MNIPLSGESRIDSVRLLNCHNGHSRDKDGYLRIDLNVPAPTRTAACYNLSKGRFVHPAKTTWDYHSPRGSQRNISRQFCVSRRSNRYSQASL